MKRYTMTDAREKLAEVLNQAERGEDVIIERRGVRFSVRAVAATAAPRRRAARVELIDPDVEAGTWSWSWSPGADVALTDTERRPVRKRHA